MNRTKIEWCNGSVNPVKGLCPVDCKDLQGHPYCYARRIYKRYSLDPTIRYDPWVFEKGPRVAKGSRIFVGSTMELFGSWVPDDWMENILGYCAAASAHTFMFLTKRPQELAKYNPWPHNCWVGVSVPDVSHLEVAALWMRGVEATVRFASFEPLLEDLRGERLSTLMDCLQWAIIGARTQPLRMPSYDWVEEIVAQAEERQIPIFLKNNLYTPDMTRRRQEWPKERTNA